MSKDLTVKELRTLLDAANIAYKSRDRKSDLLAKVEEIDAVVDIVEEKLEEATGRDIPEGLVILGVVLAIAALGFLVA